MNFCMMSYQQYFDSTTKNQSDNITIAILTVFEQTWVNFRALKKPTSWKRTEQRAVIKNGKTAEKTLQTLGNSLNSRKVHRKY